MDLSIITALIGLPSSNAVKAIHIMLASLPCSSLVAT